MAKRSPRLTMTYIDYCYECEIKQTPMAEALDGRTSPTGRGVLPGQNWQVDSGTQRQVPQSLKPRQEPCSKHRM